MGYIMDMRKYVGHRPIIICGASVIVINEKGEILLQKRADNGLWGYAGGCTEIDEPVEEAAARELEEETGLTADKLTLFDVFSGPKLHYIYPNGDEISAVEHLFLCREYHGSLKMQEEEVTELRFFAPNDVPPMEQISPPNRPGLQAYLEAFAHDGGLKNQEE